MKISAVHPADHMNLNVWFTGGVVKRYDVSALIEKWVSFQAPEDPALFRCVKVDAGGYGISWNDDHDLSCSELWEQGVEVSPAREAQDALIADLVSARQQAGASQKSLEDATGIKQPVIARMEKGTTSPQLDTVLKALAPLGKTLKVVD